MKRVGALLFLQLNFDEKGSKSEFLACQGLLGLGFGVFFEKLIILIVFCEEKGDLFAKELDFSYFLGVFSQ